MRRAAVSLPPRSARHSQPQQVPSVRRLLALRREGKLTTRHVRVMAEALGVRAVWRWLAAAEQDEAAAAAPGERTRYYGRFTVIPEVRPAPAMPTTRPLPPGHCHAPRCCVTVAYLKQPAPRSGVPPTALFAGSPTLRPVWSARPPGCPPSVHVRNTAPYSFGPVSGHAAPVPGGWRRIMAGGARPGALRTSTGRAAPSPPSRQPDALHQDFQ